MEIASYALGAYLMVAGLPWLFMSGKLTSFYPSYRRYRAAFPSIPKPVGYLLPLSFPAHWFVVGTLSVGSIVLSAIRGVLDVVDTGEPSKGGKFIVSADGAVDGLEAYLLETAKLPDFPFKRALIVALVEGIRDEFSEANQEKQFPEGDAYKRYLEWFKTRSIAKYVREKSLEAINAFYAGLPNFVGAPVMFFATVSEIINDERLLESFFRPLGRFTALYERWAMAKALADFGVSGDLFEKGSRQYYADIAEVKGFPFDSVPLPITIPEHLRFEGVWIVAPRGTGKTTLLSAMLKADLELVKRGKASVIIMDSKGDLINHARELEVFQKELKGRLVLIEPTGNLAINPLDLGASMGHTIELVEYLFSFGMATTHKQSTLFRSVLIAMQAIPNANFGTFRDFLRQGWKPYEKYILTLHPEDRDFFIKPGAKGRSDFDDAQYDGTKQELLTRFQDLTTRVPLLRDMFRSTKTLIELGKEMDAGKVIIIDNNSQVLGDVGTEFFGRFFLALIRGQAEQRASREDSEKLPCFVYIDECHEVISEDVNVEKILQKCRSQKIGMVMAHQNIVQIKSPTVLKALRDSGVRIANSDDDAAELAGPMRAEAEDIRDLQRGQFAVFMRRLMKRSVIVTVDDKPIWKWPKMLPSQLVEIRREMAAKYSFTPPPRDPPPREESDESPDDTSPKTWG